MQCYFKKDCWWTQVLFLGPLIPLFWTSGNVSPGFHSQSGQPYSHLTEVYVLHVVGPLVWYMPTSLLPAWQLTCCLSCACEQALLGLKIGIYHAVATQCETRQMLYWLSYVSSVNSIWLYKCKCLPLPLAEIDNSSTNTPEMFSYLVESIRYVWSIYVYQ